MSHREHVRHVFRVPLCSLPQQFSRKFPKIFRPTAVPARERYLISVEDAAVVGGDGIN
jgi:hypothetical protein